MPLADFYLSPVFPAAGAPHDSRPAPLGGGQIKWRLMSTRRLMSSKMMRSMPPRFADAEGYYLAATLLKPKSSWPRFSFYQALVVGGRRYHDEYFGDTRFITISPKTEYSARQPLILRRCTGLPIWPPPKLCRHDFARCRELDADGGLPSAGV